MKMQEEPVNGRSTIDVMLESENIGLDEVDQGQFDQEKLIEMVKYLGNSTPETTFKEDFLAVYGFELSYEKINELYGIH